MRLVAVNLPHAVQHPGAGSHLAAEAARMAHVLMAALVVERVGQQQNSLK